MSRSKPNIFTPTAEEALTQPPAALSEQSDVEGGLYAGLRLESVPVRGLGVFLVTSLFLLVLLAGWQAWQFYQQMLTLHWLAAAAFAGLLAVVGLAAMVSLWSFLRGRQELKRLYSLRSQAGRLEESLDLGGISAFTQQLEHYYQAKPQGDFLAHSLQHLADYSTDKEATEHLEHSFLAPLDREASQRVSKYSLQTAVAVSLSPWVSLDMLLALWRNLRMIDEVAQVYGVRPAWGMRMKLLKMVAKQLLMVGASEAAIDAYAEQIGIDTLGSLAAARGFQGLGAGVYSLRIGIAAMQVCRPIEFKQNNQPKFAKVAAGMLAELKKVFSRGR